MAQFLDEAAITGVAPKGAAPTPVPTGAQFLDESAITGRPPEPPTFLDNLRGFLGEKAGEVGAAAKSVGEFVGAGIGMAGGAVAGSAKAIEEMAKGKPRREALQSGIETSARVGAALNPVTVATKLLGYAPDPTVLDNVMEQISKGIHHYGEKVEVGTKGALLAEDVDLFAQLLMGAGMGKATVKGVEAGVKKATAAPARGTSMADMTQVGLPVPRLNEIEISTPEQVKGLFEAAKRNRPGEVSDTAAVDSIFARAKAKGLAQVGPTPAEAVAQSKSRIAEGKVLGEVPAQSLEEALVVPHTDTALDTGLAKLRAGQGFLVTPEERIALRATLQAGGKIVGEDGKPLGAGFTESGQVDPRLLTALGITSAAVWAALAPEDQEKLATAGLIGATMLTGEASPLGALKKQMHPYRFEVLEKLPEGKFDFGKQQILDLLKKPELQAERSVVEAVLGAVEGDRIKAKELVEGLLGETSGWKLAPKETAQYADYGLESIRRDAYANSPSPELVKSATTTQYELPEHMQISDANHFGNSRLFGWTRSFVEDGIRHVVEIQSDLAQKASKRLTDAEVLAKQEQLREARRDWKEWLAEAKDRMANGGSQDGIDQALRYADQAELRVTELDTALRADEQAFVTEKISPILKNWPRRLIREELKKNADQDVVRFASADTVAKVEGWPTKGRTEGQITGDILHWEDLQKAAREGRTGPSGLRPDVALARAETRIADLKTELQEAQARKGQPPEFQVPGHQSIYNRYAGEITRYLKGLGGAEIRDAQGHTWWEVPTKPTVSPEGRIKMLGRADPELLAKIAGGVALGAYLVNPENREGLAMLGVGTLAATRGKFKGLPESAVIEAALKGDQSAYAKLYAETEPMLRKANFMREAEAKGVDTQGIIQTAFMKGFSNLSAFEQGSKFSTWMYTIARNELLKHYDALKARISESELTPEMAETAGHEGTPQRAMESTELGGQLQTALDKLDPAFRESFLLREAEGLSYEEIAAQRGIPVATAKTQVFRAKEQLQRHLREYAADFGQRGAATPEQLAGLAAIAGGAALGAYLDPEHPIKGGLFGAGVGTLLGMVKPSAWLDAIKAANKTGARESIADYVRDRLYGQKVARRATYNMTTRIEDAVPEVARREAIYDYLEGERKVTLTPAERAVAEEVRAWYQRLGELAKSAGVISGLVDDYATRIYRKTGLSMFEGKRVGGNTATESPFGKPRGYKTRAEAEAAGYVPITTDIARVLEIYSDSVNAAIMNRAFIDTLKDLKSAEGVGLIAKEGHAPPDYRFIDHPQLRGLRVHPDIAPDLKFVFDSVRPGAVAGMLDAINSTQKRMGVSLSFFHALALEHAMLGATSVLKSPARGARIFAQSFAPAVFGENLAVKMIREGGAGDMVDRAIKAGVEFSLERRGAVMEEERPGLYKAMEAVTKHLDELVPKSGTVTTGALLKLNHAFDRAMWGRFHAALKLETFMDKASELSRNNARAVEQGKAILKSQAEIDRMASSFTNDLYGGLNWYELMNEFSSRWGRELAAQTFNPVGRFAMRMALFAPDWTISTTRAFMKSFGQREALAAGVGILGTQVDPEHRAVGGALGTLLGLGLGKRLGLETARGSGIRGALPTELGGRPETLADLHRQYFLRSAFIYTGIVDAINYQMSGHHIWDNKDPTRLDRGDGTTMQVSKHFMEPFHWLLDPKKTAMGKLSFVVKETASQLTDSEYWAPGGAPRMGGVDRNKDIPLGTRVGHAARQFAPISAQGFELSNPTKAAWSMAGMPVYGKTYAERAEAKRKLKELHATPEYKELKARRKAEKERGQR